MKWSSLHPLTRGLLLFVLLNTLLLNLSLALAGFNTTLHHAAALLIGSAEDDSWEPMRQALAYVRSGQATPLYQVVFFERGTIFTYPPVSLFFLEIVGLVTGQALPSDAALNLLSGLAVYGTACAAVLLLLGSVRVHLGAAFDDRPRERMLLALLGAGLTLTFYPIVKAFSLGQIQTIITCLVAWSMVAWTSGRRTWAGLLCGLACLIKPQIGLLVAWALLRKQWVFVRGWCTVALPLLALSVWRYGLADQWDYMAQLSFITRHSWSYYPNQSVNGLLNRALFIGENLRWDVHYVPYNTWVYGGTLISSVLLIGGALLWRVRADSTNSLAAYALAALSFTMASPVAWEHHYGLMLPIFAWFAPATLGALRDARAHGGAALLLGAYLLSSNLLAPLNVFAPTHLNFLQGYLFAGAVLLLAFLYRTVGADASRREERPGRA